MSETFRFTEIYISTQTGRLTDSAGGEISGGNQLPLFRNDRVVVRAHLIAAYGEVNTYFTPPVGAVWYAGIDGSYDPAVDDPVRTEDAEFNVPSYWPDLDVANGKIALLLNLATTQLKDVFVADGNPASKQMGFEIWMTPSGGSATLLGQISVSVNNIRTDIDSSTTLVTSQDNVIRFDGADVVLLYPDGSVAQRWSS